MTSVTLNDVIINSLTIMAIWLLSCFVQIVSRASINSLLLRSVCVVIFLTEVAFCIHSSKYTSYGGKRVTRNDGTGVDRIHVKGQNETKRENEQIIADYLLTV